MPTSIRKDADLLTSMNRHVRYLLPVIRQKSLWKQGRSVRSAADVVRAHIGVPVVGRYLEAYIPHRLQVV